MKVEAFLSERGVDFQRVPHRESHGARQLAKELQVSAGDVAKTVLLRADHGYRYFVAVLPADKEINFGAVSCILGHCQLELASEAEIAERCPDCERGVLPPFGSVYGMKTIADESLTNDDDVYFEGDTHHEAIRMKFADFRRIEEPLILALGKGPQTTPSP